MLRSRETEKQKVIAQAYAENNESLRTYVRACVSGADVAEDIIQEVFVEVLRRYDVFIEHPNQIGWLYVTARHKMQEYEKRCRRSRIAEGDIEATPYRTGRDDSPCRFCDFKDACHFDPTMKKDKLRFLPVESPARVHEILEEEEGEQA